MNPAHLHLMINHVPVIGAIVAAGLLAYGVFRIDTDIARAALGLFVLMAVAGVAVYLTGEPAEELVEELASVSSAALHQHEDAALLATILLGTYGVFATGVLLAFRKREARLPSRIGTLAVALSIVPLAAMAYTANLGGQIRHTEIGSAEPAHEEIADNDPVFHPAFVAATPEIEF